MSRSGVHDDIIVIAAEEEERVITGGISRVHPKYKIVVLTNY